MFTIIDDVTTAIERKLLAFPPERGGAMLGLPGLLVITAFIYDEEAATTGASFVPSKRLTAQVREHEQTSGTELKGIIHTHPDSFDRLSGPDHRAVACGLDANPHLSTYLCPIGTRVPRSKAVRENELWLKGGKLSWFIGRRKRPHGISISEVTARILPIGSDSQGVAEYLGVDSVVDTGVVELEGRQFFGRQIVLSERMDLTLLFGLDYPVSPPIAFIGQNDGQTMQLPLHWPVERPPQERLPAALRPYIHRTPSGGRTYRSAWGPTANLPLTEDAKMGASANWPLIMTNADTTSLAATFRDESLARTRGLLPASLAEKRVLITGNGTVGTYAAEQLVRSGIALLDLVDPERVERANLSRTSFRAADVGDLKVVALARNLLNINPCASITQHAVSIQDLGVAGLDNLVKAADLVFNAADDPSATKALGRFAYARGKPFVSVGLFAGAQGGEVIVSVPERTPCPECATQFRRVMEREAGRVSQRTDYGTGRLQGEVALGVDVHHVASAAVKLALSLMMPIDAKGALRDLAEEAVSAKTPYLLMGMVPNYWFFPALFQDVPGQHAYQAVWAEVEGNPECPICGKHRVDPLTVPLRSPSAAAFKNALANVPSTAHAAREAALRAYRAIGNTGPQDRSRESSAQEEPLA
jgi:hypothetical protein